MSRTGIRLNGPKIRQLREDGGIMFADLAADVGISGSHLSKIELGQGGCSPRVAGRLAHILGVTVQDLRA